MTIKHLGGIFGRNPTFNDVTIDGGIYIGGNTSSNLLDDYEEGVHIAGITCSTSGAIGTVSSNNELSYTKIGNVVHVSGYLYVSAVSSPVGYFDISLPFTAADLQDKGGDCAASIWMTNINAGANVADFMGIVTEGTDYLRVGLGDGTVVSGDSAQQVKSGTQIKVSLTYKAA